MPLLALLLPLAMFGLIFALGYYEDLMLHHPYQREADRRSGADTGEDPGGGHGAEDPGMLPLHGLQDLREFRELQGMHGAHEFHDVLPDLREERANR
ncbi:hypothetical protein [Streptomyces sp. ODS28]|uniref:hypothetical protein n=1 Tax=Streptomyces sp. ODS28 TaxID=3136688 RepID=UPI0031E9A923